MKTFTIVLVSILTLIPYILLFQYPNARQQESYEETLYLSLYNHLICICIVVFMFVKLFDAYMGVILLLHWLTVIILFILSMVIRMVLNSNAVLYRQGPISAKHAIIHDVSVVSLIVLMITAVHCTYEQSADLLNLILGTN